MADAAASAPWERSTRIGSIARYVLLAVIACIVLFPIYTAVVAALKPGNRVLVNPLVDGMNLVAKEAVVVSERDAVLVLSETAGAFDQMADGALPVAPADVVGTAEALARGLAMEPADRTRRLAKLRRGVEREDITWWLGRQLEDLAELTGAV